MNTTKEFRYKIRPQSLAKITFPVSPSRALRDTKMSKSQRQATMHGFVTLEIIMELRRLWPKVDWLKTLMVCRNPRSKHATTQNPRSNQGNVPELQVSATVSDRSGDPASPVSATTGPDAEP